MKKQQIEKLLHLILVLTTVWAIGAYGGGPADSLGSSGLTCLRYFTTDSNILACAASALWLLLPQIRENRWFRILRFAGTVSVAVTFLVVIFFLAPMAAVSGNGLTSALRFYAGNVFILHFTTPILALIANLLAGSGIERRESLCAMLPMGLYSIVYLVMVVSGTWRDWYGFTFGGNFALIPIVLAVLYAFTAGLSLALWQLMHITENPRRYTM